MTEAWKLPQAEKASENVTSMPGPSAEQKPASNKQTLVEDGTKFEGVLTSTCPLVVRGQIEGEVFGPSLTVSSSGVVAGTVKVDEIRSEGVLAGEFDATRVELSGQVRDKTVIRAKSLEVKLAPEKGRMEVVFGECDLEVGEPVSKEEAVDQAAEPKTDESAESKAEQPSDKEKAEDKKAEGAKKKKKK